MNLGQDSVKGRFIRGRAPNSGDGIPLRLTVDFQCRRLPLEDLTVYGRGYIIPLECWVRMGSAHRGGNAGEQASRSAPGAYLATIDPITRVGTLLFGPLGERAPFRYIRPVLADLRPAHIVRRLDKSILVYEEGS